MSNIEACLDAAVGEVAATSELDPDALVEAVDTALGDPQCVVAREREAAMRLCCYRCLEAARVIEHVAAAMPSA